MPRNFFAYNIQCELSCPKSGRKVSRNVRQRPVVGKRASANPGLNGQKEFTGYLIAGYETEFKIDISPGLP